MRHLVLALMILLLPLRGWMGDAMATNMAIDMAINMAGSTATTTKIIAPSAHRAGPSSQFEHQTSDQAAVDSAMPVQPDCAGHASGGAAPLEEAHNAQDEHCNPCQACQACHTVALSPALRETQGIFSEPLMPRAVAAQFTSALTALGQKPPIS